MKIDLESIRNKLSSGNSSLVDPRILQEDMHPMWDYAVATGDCKECVKTYCEQNSEFDLLKFTTAYLSDLMNDSIKVSYTEDNYVMISL